MQINIINRLNRWFADHYGSRRGFVRTIWYRIRYFAGGYRHYRKIDWRSVERLVFVCKGNICRSAYAEAVAKSLDIDSVSCGVDTRNNYPANEKAILAAEVKGFYLKEHRTTPIQLLDIRASDLFIAMEPWQADLIGREYGDKCKCSLLGLWGRPLSPHIQDPYNATVTYFDNCFTYIEKSVHEVASKVKEAR